MAYHTMERNCIVVLYCGIVAAGEKNEGPATLPK